VNKPTLILFTEGHPDIDTGFIIPELTISHIYFEQVIVYPLRWNAKHNQITFPSNVFFKSELAFYVKSISSLQKKISGISSPLFWSSILKIDPLKIKSLLNTCGYIKMLAKWIRKLEFDRFNTIFYSYWLLSPALALGSLKQGGYILYQVSRAHGIDLYNQRGDYILNFFKPYIFQNLNKLFCVSEFGMKYLSEMYTNYSDKFTVSRLGTFNKTIISTNIPESLEIVSCSFLTPVKRIDLLIKGLENFQKIFPAIRIKWTHVGAGPLFDSLNNLAGQKLKPGTFTFTGTLSIPEIYDLYTTKTYACLVNVSASEGLPVSIMEAQSFGIPVIATAVGGTPEIVNDENGHLLAADPNPNEIASAICDVVINEKKWEKKRMLSRKNWEKKFDAEKNYLAFSHELLSILDS
jgi:colanic acid/amylovoran biosynthesis glycosyltransferase